MSGLPREGVLWAGLCAYCGISFSPFFVHMLDGKSLFVCWPRRLLLVVSMSMSFSLQTQLLTRITPLALVYVTEYYYFER